jgi:hypothetical protein
MDVYPDALKKRKVLVKTIRKDSCRWYDLRRLLKYNGTGRTK